MATKGASYNLDLDSAGSVINWPPRSGSIMLIYESMDLDLEDQ
jgi:hypothetical protein